MDKQKAKRISEDIERALESVAEKHGCKLQNKAGSLNRTTFSPKFVFIEIGDDGVVESDERVALKARHPELVDKVIQVAGRPEPLKIIGYRTRAQKRPYLLTDGEREYTCPHSTIVAAEKRAQQNA